jgi:hypothetical protein
MEVESEETLTIGMESVRCTNVASLVTSLDRSDSIYNF